MMGFAIAVLVTLSSWAMADTAAQSDGESSSTETSAWAQVGGGEKQSISKGDVLARADRLPDGSCDSMSYSVGMQGDVKSIKTQVNEKDCTLVVLDVVLNPMAAELEALINEVGAGNEASAKPWTK